MRGRIVRALLLTFTLRAWLAPPSASAGSYRLEYEVQPVPPAAGRQAATRVSLTISDCAADPKVLVRLPAWSPGDYHRQDHGQYVRSFTVADPQDKALPVEHPDVNSWEVSKGTAAEIRIRYELPNTPPGIFSENVKVTEKYAFYNGTAVYAYVEGHLGDPATVTFKRPAGWKTVVCPLPEEAGAPNGDLRFLAPDYDTLGDSPIAAGDVATRTFTAAARPHTVAFFNDHSSVRYDEFPPVLEKIVDQECRMMGGPPYSHYVFFLDCGGPRGGLEHLNSTRISWFPGASAIFLASAAAHEYFHLWNVKRIRPAILGPFDYQRVPRTRNLWFCEGVTSYYGNLSLVRAGLASEEQYLRRLAGTIAGLQRNPARLRVTADECSLRVEEAGNSDGFGGLSYYTKGELIGLCLDLKLRSLTQNRESLDSVMRDLLARCAPPKPGYPEDGLREAVIRAGGPAMGPFYDRCARTTEELPFADALGAAGLRFSANSFRIEADPAAPESARNIRHSWLSPPTQ